MKNYYKILGISPSASQEEIRTAYRKLAHKYHPDKNKAANAHAQFNKLKKAYEVLSNPQRRRQYDYFLNNQWQQFAKAWESHSKHQAGQAKSTTASARTREAQQRAYRSRQASKNQQQSQKKKSSRFSRRQIVLTHRLSMLTAALTLLLFIDYFLPITWSREHVEQIHAGILNANELDPASYIIRTDATRFPARGHSNKQNFPYKDTDVWVGKTTITGEELYMTYTKGERRVVLDVYYSIYDTFLFLLIALSITSAAGVAFYKDPDVVFNLGIFNVILSAFIAFFIAF